MVTFGKIIFGIFLRCIVLPISIIIFLLHILVIGFFSLTPIYWLLTNRDLFEDNMDLMDYSFNYKIN